MKHQKRQVDNKLSSQKLCNLNIFIIYARSFKVEHDLLMRIIVTMFLVNPQKHPQFNEQVYLVPPTL